MSIRDRMVRNRLFQLAKEPIRDTLRRLGYDVRRTGSTSESLTRQLLVSDRIDLLVDVGANQGQYARHMRYLGYSGELISFEPGADAYRLLRRAASDDRNWVTIRAAIGAHDGSAMLNVSANLVSSSLLQVSELHKRAELTSEIVSRETVPIVTLDGQLTRYGVDRNVWLKLDVQGYEGKVLRGAERTLPQCKVIQCEASLRELYEDGIGHLDLLQLIRDQGFTLVWLEPGFGDPATGELLQFDFIAARR